MASEDLTVRRSAFTEFEGQLETLLEAYHEFVAEEFGRWLAPADSMGEESRGQHLAFTPESYVAGELAKDLAYLGDPPIERPVVVALDDGVVVGTAYLYRLSDTHGEVKRLFVSEEYRGLGLGEALVTAVVDVANDVGLSMLRLDTAPFMQSALSLYEKLGFEEYDGGESISDIPESMLDDITYMKLRLRSEG